MPGKGWRVRWNIRAKHRLCPKCDSPLKELGSLSGWLTPNFFACEKCGYTGYVYIEQDENVHEG